MILSIGYGGGRSYQPPPQGQSYQPPPPQVQPAYEPEPQAPTPDYDQDFEQEPEPAGYPAPQQAPPQQAPPSGGVSLKCPILTTTTTCVTN